MTKAKELSDQGYVNLVVYIYNDSEIDHNVKLSKYGYGGSTDVETDYSYVSGETTSNKNKLKAQSWTKCYLSLDKIVDGYCHIYCNTTDSKSFQMTFTDFYAVK